MISVEKKTVDGEAGLWVTTWGLGQFFRWEEVQKLHACLHVMLEQEGLLAAKAKRKVKR